MVEHIAIQLVLLQLLLLTSQFGVDWDYSEQRTIVKGYIRQSASTRTSTGQ